MMTARDDTSTRPANSTSWRCCWPARHSASLAARNSAPKAITTLRLKAPSRTPSPRVPAPATAPSCAHRRKCRSRSSPTPPARPPASRPRPRKRAIPPRTASRARRRRQRRLGRRCLGRGAPGRAGIHAQRRRAQPRAAAADLHALPCFSPAMQCTAQRVTLTLAPTALARPRRLPGKRRQAGRAGGRTRLLERHRRTPVARDPAGRQGQRTRRIRRRRQQCCACAPSPARRPT